MEATGEAMKRHWECFNCDGKKLTIRMDFEKIYIECDSCKAVEWVKR